MSFSYRKIVLETTACLEHLSLVMFLSIDVSRRDICNTAEADILHLAAYIDSVSLRMLLRAVTADTAVMHRATELKYIKMHRKLCFITKRIVLIIVLLISPYLFLQDFNCIFQCMRIRNAHETGVLYNREQLVYAECDAHSITYIIRIEQNIQTHRYDNEHDDAALFRKPVLASLAV